MVAWEVGASFSPSLKEADQLLFCCALCTCGFWSPPLQNAGYPWVRPGTHTVHNVDGGSCRCGGTEGGYRGAQGWHGLPFQGPRGPPPGPPTAPASSAIWCFYRAVPSFLIKAVISILKQLKFPSFLKHMLVVAVKAVNAVIKAFLIVAHFQIWN